MTIAIIEKEKLAEAISAARTAIENTNTIPILANVVLSFHGSQLTATGTNLDLQVESTAPAQIDGQEFKTTVNAAIFSRLIQQYNNGSEVRIEAEGDKEITISSGRNNSTLYTLPVEDFPSLNVAEWDSHFEIAGSVLAKMFESVAPSISNEETRYYLNGPFLHIRDENLIAVATNGHTLCKSIAGFLPDGLDNYEGQIIPSKTVMAFLAASKKHESTWQCSVSHGKIRFDNEKITIVSKVIDGTFPDYSRVIPKDAKTKIKFNASDFSRMIKRVAAVSIEKTKAIALTINEDTIAAEIMQRGEGTSTDAIESKIITGEHGLRIGFNSDYLTVMMDKIESKEAFLHVEDASTPGKITAENSDDFSIIMPMRV